MAVDMFIKLGDIKGETGDSKHKDEIEVFNFSWGTVQLGGSSVGGGAGSGKVNVQDFNFTKKTDKSSPTLMQRCCTGEHIKDALFVARKAGGTQVEFLKIKLTDILISGWLPSGDSSGEVPMEQVSLNFAKCEVDYQPQGADGKAAGGPIHGGWDLKQNIKA